VKNRLILVFFVFILISLGIASRIIYLQLFKNDRLEKLADSQFSRLISIRSKRGIIYDRFGEELAISVESASVYVHPPLVRAKRETARFISQTLKLDFESVYKKINQKKTFVWIARQMPREYGNVIKAKKLPGVGVFPEPRRRYPNNSLASQLLGFVGIDGDGLEGIELAYDRYLRGDMHYFRGLTDAFGRPMTAVYRTILREEESSLVLTLDKSLQYLAEKEIENTVKEFSAERGVAIIANPKTGEILALAQYPNFNPNYFANTPPSGRRNRILTDVFEPGSTFKTFLLAAALDEGVITPKTQFFCENGLIKIRGKKIGEAQNHKWAYLSAEDILKFSSNIGALKIAQKLGTKKYYNKILDFGFGKSTGIGLHGEAGGIIRPLPSWTDLDLATAAFGQGISITPLQMVAAFSAIANEGVYMAPYLVKEVMDRKGEKIFSAEPKPLRQVISKETADTMKNLLVRVSEKGGTGFAARLPYFDIAVKTGTAQKPNPYGKGYLNEYVSSFIGFFPKDDPMYTILVYVDEPQKAHYSSEVAAPVFKKIAQSMVRLYSKKFQNYIEPASAVSSEETGD